MKGPRKIILSVRICILRSRSCILSTRVCLKYVNWKTGQSLGRRKITLKNMDFNNDNENPLFCLILCKAFD